MKALTILQPFAHLICDGAKPVENRTWNTRVRGPIAIHAGKTFYEDDVQWCEKTARRRIDPDALSYGAIIGVAELVDVVRHHPSKWFVGPFGFLLRNARFLTHPVQCRGALGFWSLSPALERRVLLHL